MVYYTCRFSSVANPVPPLQNKPAVQWFGGYWGWWPAWTGGGYGGMRIPLWEAEKCLPNYLPRK